MNVIFDTCAYRTFYEKYLKNKSKGEQLAAIIRLRERERANNIKPILNIFVLAELMKHLSSQDDPGYYICSRTILFTYLHTCIDKNVGFTPPAEFEICSEYIGKLPESFETFLGRLGTLYFEILANMSSQNIAKYKEAFLDIERWLNEYKLSFIESYSQYLNSEDPVNGTTWEIYKDDKDKRRAYITHIRNDNRKVELAIGLLLFLGNHLDYKVEFEEEEFLRIANEIAKNREMGFILMLRILNMFINKGGYDLSTANRPNDIIDFLFALSLDTNKDRILVTEDKDLIRYSAEMKINKKVMRLNDYLKLIGY